MSVGPDYRLIAADPSKLEGLPDSSINCESNPAFAPRLRLDFARARSVRLPDRLTTRVDETLPIVLDMRHPFHRLTSIDAPVSAQFAERPDQRERHQMDQSRERPFVETRERAHSPEEAMADQKWV
jgi:hypothetical protein